MAVPDINFACTQCGDCCRGLWLPLSVEEAIRWTERGHPVDVLCEAIPWPAEPTAEDLAAQFKRSRSFTAHSGALPIRVLVTLAAPQGDACPHLQSDARCGIYTERPEVCRSYPAETLELQPFDPARCRCPPEAWSGQGEPFLRNARYVNPAVVQLVSRIETRASRELMLRQTLCSLLGVRVAALANEGYAIHTFPAGTLHTALLRLPQEVRTEARDWQFVSGVAQTLDILASCDAQAIALPDRAPDATWTFVSRQAEASAAAVEPATP